MNMNLTDNIQNLLNIKYPNLQFRLNTISEGVVINLIDTQSYSSNNTSNNKLAAHISYELCDNDGLNYIYLNFIKIETEYTGTGLSKYIMGYFIGHLIQKFTNIRIELENATNNTIRFNLNQCKRMKSQVRSIINNNNTILPRNSVLRNKKVRIVRSYWNKFGFKMIDDDPSSMEYTGNLINLYNQMVNEINKDSGFLTNLFSSSTGGHYNNSSNIKNNKITKTNKSNKTKKINKIIKTKKINKTNIKTNNNTDNKKEKMKIYTGKKGGKYYIKNNKKVYIRKSFK